MLVDRNSYLANIWYFVLEASQIYDPFSNVDTLFLRW